MKIKLTNIRQHKYKEVEFRDRGIVRLKGLSGAGKSTFFDAIRQALFGDVQGMTHWDESTSRIELEWLEMSMVRNHKPNFFKLEKNSKSFVDDEADAEVMKTLDMTSDEFIASSYIQQEFVESLLTLSPADQLRLIQHLAFGKENPETTKEKIKQSIQTFAVAIQVGERMTTTWKETAEKLQAETQFLFAQHLKTSKPVVAPDPGFGAAIAALNLKALSARKKIEQYNGLESSPVYSMIENLAVKEEMFKEVFLINDPLIRDAKGRIAQLPSVGDLAPLLDEKAKLESSKHFFFIQKRVKELTAQYDEQYPARDKSQKLLEYIESQIKTISEFVEKDKESLQKAQLNLDAMVRSKDSLACPECKTALKYINGQLQPHDHSSYNLALEETYKANIANLSKTLYELNHRLQALFVDQREMLALKDKMTKTFKPTVKTEEELFYQILQIEGKIEQLKTVHLEKRNEESSIGLATAAISRAEKYVTDLRLQIDRYGTVRPQNEIALEMTLARTEFESVSQELLQITQAAAEHSENKQALVLWERDKETHSKAQVKLSEAALKLKDRVSDLDEARANHTAALRLKEISDVAALEAIAAIFQSINFNAQTYIERMFPDTGTQVLLKNKKELLSGQERAKPSIYIFHKGSVVKNFKELSGGEKGRIKLAFHLALSDLYRSPILMLDEPLIGMDEASRNLAIDCLENISQNKLVLMVEHNMQDSQATETIEIM